jgi:large subunit ribosomal protein L15
MKAHELKPTPGSNRPRKRVGRGISAGQGKTAGRGQKGQGSRSSVNIPHSFEGGQMPLAQRLPKLRGFTNINRREFAVVNLGKLNRFEAGTEVNPELLKQVGLVRKTLGGVKILAAGKLKVALKVSAHRISAGAQEQIEALGGSIELIGPQTADKIPRRHKAKAAKPEPEQPAPKGKGKAKAAKGEASAQPEVEAEGEAAAGADAGDDAESTGGSAPDEARAETSGDAKAAEDDDAADPGADTGRAESSPEE